MDQVITIPEQLIREKELVLLPRSRYEELLRSSREQRGLNAGIKESLKEAQQGKVIGPFEDSEKLIRSLSP